MVKDCEVYIKMKVSRYKPYRKLQILLIFEQTWGLIIIDFIVKLFKSKDPVNNTSYNNILVIIKRFTKYSKFISINESHSIEDLTDTVIQKIINNYRLSDEFVINKSIIFALRFFTTLIVKLRVNNKFSIAFYP